jgi:hypothetical protein
MATLTKEQRAEKRAERIAAQAIEQQRLDAEEAVRRAELLKVLPKRLMDAQALASSLGLSVEVSLSEYGPVVQFGGPDEPGDIDTELTYQSEIWEVEWLEKKLQSLKEEQDARAARRELAQRVFSLLDTDAKAAVKEFIHYLK